MGAVNDKPFAPFVFSFRAFRPFVRSWFERAVMSVTVASAAGRREPAPAPRA